MRTWCACGAHAAPSAHAVPTRCPRVLRQARGGGDAVWDLVDSFMQYDSIAVLAAIPSLREAYFAPTLFTGPMRQPVSVRQRQ